MFDVLKKYKENDHFFLRPNDDLDVVCNSPSKNGVFLIYSLNRGRIELVYIGCTDMTSETPGLRGQICSRNKFLKSIIKEEGSDALDIYWYVTSNSKTIDNPKEVEFKILQKHIEIYATVPRWNK
jgi:hypothetical protein